ncbi:MAG TPA: hypothetical protein VFU94_10245 [Conexibacter sp.]|nr:hypothetical protein [Conexibacter sp.]
MQDDQADRSARIALVRELADLTIEEERRSAENLGARSTRLIGFVGVLLTLLAAFGRDASAATARLGRVGQPLAAVLALAAVPLLVTAAFVAASVVQPRSRGRLPGRLFDDLASGALTAARAPEEIADLRHRIATSEMVSNDARGKALGVAFWFLVGALVLVSGEAGIPFFHRAGIW